MLVSWNWLSDYLNLDLDRETVENRLAMSGLNHEETHAAGDDFCIDLEVTSNRPDCLGHIGVAREIGVLFDRPLCFPNPQPAAAGPAVETLAKVTLQTDLCPRYTARVIQGVKVGPSPEWLVKRLETIYRTKSAKWKPVNNIVDITNYVLMESGQPLHAFDLQHLAGSEIIVRTAAAGEKLEAIDHQVYELDPGMCVIADARQPVALAGVMGGAATEVQAGTTNLLIESADFDSLSIRSTARKLKLHSDSSYRFERGVDPAGIDWASRRCCELILEIAGGELAAGVIDVGAPAAERKPVVLRLAQVERILGIRIPADEIRRILAALGNQEVSADEKQLVVNPPTWRRDLDREIDLIEEVARVHGYEQIPENASVPMAASHRSDHDRVLAKVRQVLNAAGFDEAMTISMISEDWSQAFSPWTDRPPIQASTPMIKGADRMRRSIVPSLLEARRINQAAGNDTVELFETAKIYLPQGAGLPREPWTLALSSGRSYHQVKGVIEALLNCLNPDLQLTASDTDQPLLDGAASAELSLAGQRFGFLGEVAAAGLKKFGLRSAATIAELDLSLLVAQSQLTPQHRAVSAYPAISHDLNFVVAESLRWSDLADTIRNSGGPLLESVDYREVYRDPKTDGADTKRILLSVRLRSPDRTLTSDDAEQARSSIIAACQQQHAAALVG
ncbi:phenylalanine--tRNA ligase subunit beta [Lignipirellula cremea]|uniref:Phenylalanine--tRNA ligase beta subunit n=1 Tax=Lignipirellula cremea TaxID=2528010 RepID=A0A518DQR6_9BACT|nr:phenylalanine--tRNA ligase subunit beta [Lignipirellula cremea]QDU94164.1 Phenylalanine--tRNA ligase beta subunit [Lignipirellula cremea]